MIGGGLAEKIPGMPARFILGRSGAGKTHHCFEAIEQWSRDHGLASKVIFLLPRQATFIAERQLVARDSRRSLLGVRVVSPDSLAREIAPQLAESLEMVDSRGRRLLIAMAIEQCAGQLRYFRGAIQHPHLPERIDSALAEIEQSGTGIEEIRKALGQEGPGVEAKLDDLSLIESVYRQLLGERLDVHQLQERVIEAIAGSSLVAGSLVVVDGFADFTRVQRRMLVALAERCARMEVALLLDGPETRGDDSIFYRTWRTYDGLMGDLRDACVRVDPPLVLREGRRFVSPAVAVIETEFDSTRRAVAPAGADVRIIEAVSEMEEVRAVARQVRRWQTEGVRLREIGILCRDLSIYAPWIAPIFSEHGIACFIDQPRSMTHHPLVRYVRAALEIAVRGWRRSSVMELLKCGLSPLDERQCDELENFALRHGIDGEDWLADWSFTSAMAREDEASESEIAAREESERCSAYRAGLIQPIRPLAELAGAGDVEAAGVLAAIRKLIAEGHVAERLERWIDNADVELAQVHAQCRDGLLELMDAAATLFAGRKVGLKDLAMMLLASMESMAIKLAPPTLDQVLVGQIDRSRSPEFSRVIVMGLNEGTFPAAAGEDSIFGDQERERLEVAQIQINPDSTRKAMQERLIGYIALTRASRQLVLTRPTMDEAGRKRSESGFILRVKSILSDLAAEPAQRGGLADVATPAQMAGEWASALQQKAVPEHMLAAKAWAESGSAPAEFGRMMNIAEASAKYTNDAMLPPGLAGQLSGEAMTCSATRLERFAECPFRHFVEHEIRLRPREEAEVSNLDLGNAFHAVLDAVGQRMIAENLTWSSEELLRHLEEQVQRVAQELRNSVLMASERNQHLLEVIRRMLRKLIADQCLLERRTMFQVEHTECVFGPEAEANLAPLKIRTSKGREVILRGRIDRIDKRGDGQTQSYMVFDYKSSEKRLSLDEVNAGTALQLLIYMMVMRANQKEVDAALYMQLHRPMEPVPGPVEEEEGQEEAVSCKPRGVVRVDALGRLDAGLAGESKLFAAYIGKSGAPGNEHRTDLLSEADLAGLLRLVEAKVGELADRIFDGEIEIRPCQIGNQSPCPRCDFKAVCRFDTHYNQYRIIKPIGRVANLEKLNPSRRVKDAPTGEKRKRKGGGIDA